jgi:hypothetical protein
MDIPACRDLHLLYDYMLLLPKERRTAARKYLPFGLTIHAPDLSALVR